MAIIQKLRSKDAELVTDVKCKIAWRLPPKSTEEEMYRDQASAALAKIAHDVQEAVGHIILAAVKIKSER